MSRPVQSFERLEARRLLSSPVGSPAAPPAADRPLTVMSQNLYVGTDVAKLASAGSLLEVPALVASAWADVQQANFPARANVIADEIVEQQPDLIGLQEAALWRIQQNGDFFAGNQSKATTVVYDFVQTLIDDLAARGMKYKAVATATNMDIELPNALPIGAYSDIRLTDRDVMLARVDQPASQLKISNAQAGEFPTALPFSVGGVTIDVPRGWTSVDAKVRGKSYHVVEAHTETFLLDIQLAQTQELLDGAAKSALPTVVMGDFNSNANVPEPGYQMFIDDGFSDAWTVTNPADPGLTWGHADNLRDVTPSFTQRLDLILFRNGAQAQEMKVLDGAVPATPTGPLWASDHAGVVATLTVGPQVAKHDQSAGFDKLNPFSKKEIEGGQEPAVALLA